MANNLKWIRTERPFPIPKALKEVLERLDKAGHVAYIVGGSVRDFLLGREPKDHDIATDALPEQLVELFPDALTIGKAFGVICVGEFEIATFREDLAYKDHRHPEKVVFAGPEEDAKRRDFTINGLFYDPKTARILDCVGGMEDLKAGVIRAIGDPVQRFEEDALRLLRAIRLSTRLAFPIEESTAEGLRKKAKLIEKISRERIRDELELMLQSHAPHRAFQLLEEFGLLKILLPEVQAEAGVKLSPIQKATSDVLKNTYQVLKIVAENNPERANTLSWAALLQNVGKPLASSRNEGKAFNGHEIEAGIIARKVTERYKLSSEDVDRVVALVGDQIRLRVIFTMREATIQRLLGEPHFPDLLKLHRADASASDGNLAFYQFALEKWNEREKAIASGAFDPRVISGADLIQLGLQPGPLFTQILRTIEDLYFEKKIRSKNEALEYVLHHFVK